MTANSSTIRTSKASKIVIDDVLVLRMRTASLNPTTNAFEWGDSDSGEYSNRIGTRRSCTGTIVQPATCRRASRTRAARRDSSC